MRVSQLLRGAAVRGVGEAFLSGAPPHATVFFGPAGVGKRTLANALARSLFCTGARKPCGVCLGCVRTEARSHPDCIRVVPEKSIGVDAIRALTASLRQAAYEGGYKAVVLEEAGLMTVQAQNALLKTLEEPPPSTVFLLTVTALSLLLPTIVSRCTRVRVQGMPEGEILSVLLEKGVARARAEEAASRAEGSVGLALAMAADEEYWALRAGVSETLAALAAGGDAWSAVAAFKDAKADAQRVCDMLEALLVEALRRDARGDPRRAGGAARGAAFVPEMRRMLKSNVPWQAVWERFVLEYAEESKQWRR